MRHSWPHIPVPYFVRGFFIDNILGAYWTFGRSARQGAAKNKYVFFLFKTQPGGFYWDEINFFGVLLGLKKNFLMKYFLHIFDLFYY
jgi:hypothetical protein